ncbi:MAG: YicC/YloC family endoribonuclease [Wenzhouxiangellaceae bacterium]|nr:YicC/YloC family endoribonuclease [Wenzhouxiangellaceae bacterium]
MLASMTAYASSSAAGEAGHLSWEIRSVNHRYLDVSFRLPDEFRVLEPALRDRLKQRFARGKIDVTLRYQPDPTAEAATVALNEPLAASLLDQHRRLAALAGESAKPDLVRLLSWPGVVVQERADFDAERECALALFDRAAEALAEARAREGNAIAEMLAPRLDGVLEQVELVRAHLPEVRRALKQRFDERIAGLGQELEPGRLEQEIALQLTRLDVDEELDRLNAHVAEIRRVIALAEPVGRRLDFVMQELNREANTLASKAVAAETTGAAVELKVLIEQMREQIQNVE